MTTLTIDPTILLASTAGFALFATLAGILAFRFYVKLKAELVHNKRLTHKNRELEDQNRKLARNANPRSKAFEAAEELSQSIRKAQRKFEKDSGLKLKDPV